MLIEQVHTVFADLAGTNLATANPPEKVDRVLYLIIVDLFNKYLDHYVKTKKISDYLLPFKLQAPIVLTAGFGDLPDDFAHFRQVYLVDGKTPVPVVEDKFWAERVNSRVAPPSATAPIARIENTVAPDPVAKIEVVPSTIASITMLYFKKPTIQKYGYGRDGTRYVFNPDASVDLDFPIGLYPDIVVRLLNFFGIVLREGQLLEITERLKMQEQAK